MRKIVLLGSTGSIGTQTLDVVRNNSSELEVVGIAALRSVDKVEEQVREFKPRYVCMYDEDAAALLKEKIADTGIEVLSGMDGLLEIVATPEADTVLTAVVGMIGIRPTIRAIECGKDIALANKETLVCAGHIIMPLAREKNVKILPVDSEHSAIFQSLNGEPKDKVEKILLTASGGPFRGKKMDELKDMTAADA
jgi:1-deoxy-D-xylulose-5-phosphate reductoisomerase